MRTKVSLFIVVVLLLILAVPSFASAAPTQSITAGVLGPCSFVGGESLQAVSFTVVASEEITIALQGYSGSMELSAGEEGTLVSPQVPAGTFVWLEVNGELTTGFSHAANCAPTSAPPAAQDLPGDSFVCELPKPEGSGDPLYAQQVVGDGLAPWNGYLAVVEGEIQLFAHPGADQLGPWRVTLGGWDLTFDVELTGPKVCEVVVQ